MSLDQVPDKLIHIVLQHVHSLDIDNVVLANKRLRSISYTCRWMQRRRAAKLNALTMIDKFERRSDHQGPQELFGLSITAFNSSIGQALKRPKTGLLEDHLELQEDLHWLKALQDPLASEIAKSSSLVGIIKTAEEQAQNQLILDTTQRLGLTLPGSFAMLLHSLALQALLPFRFRVDDIFRWSPTGPGCGVGYLLPFGVDVPEEELIWVLYLDAEGNHCVLGAEYFPLARRHYDPQAARLIGYPEDVSFEEPLKLLSTSFESFVAWIYMERVYLAREAFGS